MTRKPRGTTGATRARSSTAPTRSRRFPPTVAPATATHSSPTTRPTGSSGRSAKAHRSRARSRPARAARSRSAGSGGRRFTLLGEEHELELSWNEGYGGGVLLAVADATSGSETYGGGRYVLDTVKGADLGVDGGRLIVDFNFAYNPSCAFDSRWSCPLARRPTGCRSRSPSESAHPP